jgi:hypothetical protein
MLHPIPGIEAKMATLTFISLSCLTEMTFIKRTIPGDQSTLSNLYH